MIPFLYWLKLLFPCNFLLPDYMNICPAKLSERFLIVWLKKTNDKAICSGPKFTMLKRHSRIVQ